MVLNKDRHWDTGRHWTKECEGRQSEFRETPAASFSSGPAHMTLPPADQHGGAEGVGQYAFMNGTLSLVVPASKYVGFWWSAANAANTMSLYDSGATLLGTLTTGSLISLLGWLESASAPSPP